MSSTRFSKKQINLVVGFLILIASLIYQSFHPKTLNIIKQAKIIESWPASQSAQLIKVAKVIDGDTIKLEDGQTVRYIGVDTPETKHPQKKLQCYGKEAMRKNKDLVEGMMIRLEQDISETDKFSRLLRYVFVPTESSPSGLFVNDYLVREGYAYSATFPPDVKYSEYFTQLQQEAQVNKKGLWRDCK